MLDRWRAFWQQAPAVTTQPQREALVDLLLLGMHTDRVLSVAEADSLAAALAELPWESGQALSIYLQANMPKIRLAAEHLSNRRQLLTSIRDRLGTPEMCQEAYRKLQAFLAVDGVAREEREFLNQVRMVLGVRA